MGGYGKMFAGHLSQRLENIVAFALLKEVHYRQDVIGQKYDLHYLRSKQGKEIDFLITLNQKPHLMIEVKESDDPLSNNFSIFSNHFSKVRKVQLVKNLKKARFTQQQVLIAPLAGWLAKMDF